MTQKLGKFPQLHNHGRAIRSTSDMSGRAIRPHHNNQAISFLLLKYEYGKQFTSNNSNNLIIIIYTMNIFNMFKTCKLIPIGNTIEKCTDVSWSVLYWLPSRIGGQVWSSRYPNDS